MQVALRMSNRPRLVELYESAAHVHQVLHRFSEAHGIDSIAPLVPEISLIFEQLERVIADEDVDRTKQILDELEHVLRRIDAVRRNRVHLGEKFDQDLNSVIQGWRQETSSLQTLIGQLSDEVDKQRNRQSDVEYHKELDAGTLSKKNAEVFAEVHCLISDIKEEVAMKDQDLVEVHKELDVNVSEIQRAVEALLIMKKRNNKLKTDNAKLEQEKLTN